MTSETPARLNTVLAGRYRVERELGRGGMATVYLADDLRHSRQVAVKVLRPELAASLGADRFLREIEILARLSHPHILPLYDSGAADGLLFYVMPFVRGESLRQRLTRGARLPVPEALALTRQVAAALQFAHARGFVHRDIKPENILLHEGEPMLADFGIALVLQGAADSRLTGTGLLVGTPDYMSPEQAAGERSLDARSDVYSLGCVLFEMLTGQPPHTGPTAQAAMANRLTEPPPAVRRVRSEVPSAVERALLRALAGDPEQRFQSAAAFAEALTESPVLPAGPSVAVLPFLNLSADPENEFFADGMTEDVIAHLARIGALKVISRTSVMAFKKREQNLRDIAAALGATTLLEGSVRRAGDRVRIVAQLIDAATDQHLWAATYDRQLTDIFAIQTDVAFQIAGALRAELSREETSRVRKEPTSDLEAYQLYLRGRQCFTRYYESGIQEGIEFYQRALGRDPGYAMPYVGLAQAYTELGETGGLSPEEAYTRGKNSALRALELDPELGEAHCALAYVLFVSEFQWDQAEREFNRALDIAPGNADAWDLYGRLCMAVGRHDEAITMSLRAQELDPLVHRVDPATAYLRAGRYAEALVAARHAVELDPKEARGYATVGWALAKAGNLDEGIVNLEHAASLTPGDTLWLAQLGQIYALAGKVDRAREILGRLEARAREQFVSPYHLAYIHAGLNQSDRAMDYLEQAFRDRSGAIYGIKGSFLFTSLHGHPRFTALLRKMNLA